MRNLLAVLAVAAGLAVPAVATANTATAVPGSERYGAGVVALSTAPTASIAKSCSAGYTHAVIGGAHKCLRVGQFCAHRYDRRYHRYGFNCRKQDARGNYHLTYRR